MATRVRGIYSRSEFGGAFSNSVLRKQVTLAAYIVEYHELKDRSLLHRSWSLHLRGGAEIRESYRGLQCQGLLLDTWDFTLLGSLHLTGCQLR